MALTQLTKIDGRGINTTSDYRVGILTAIKFVGPFDGTGGNFAGVVTATDGVFSGNVTIGGTLTYEDVTNIDSVGIITARDGLKILAGGANVVGVVTASGIDCNGDIDVDGHTNLDNVSVAGVSTFAGDVVIADSIVHDGDPNTKIRFPTDDNISFEAGATGEVARFLPTNASSGGPRMGLGTNNPTGMLHIYGANPPFRIQNSIDSANLQMGMWDASNIMFQASNRTFKFATETTNDITFFTGGLTGSYERLRITSGGTVNIGGNYSHTGSKLQVTGNSTFSGNMTVDAGANTTLDVVADSAGVAMVRATGASGDQTTAAFELVQSTSSVQGGGISYNGDGSPSFVSGETADNVTFYRILNGTRSEVFSYPYNSDTVTFNSTVIASLFQGNLSGTVNTAAQPNITSLGTLSSLTVSGTSNPVSFTHTGGNCVTFNRNSKQLAINANYAGNDAYANIVMSSGMDIRWTLGGADRINFKSAGHIEPHTDSQINLGANLKRFANVYADTYYGDGSNLTGIVADKIFEGNTEVETVDTGSDGHIKFTTEGTERLRIRHDGNIGIGNNVADSNWKLKLVVPNNSSYQNAFNVTNNTNSDFNVDIKTDLTAVGNGTNKPLAIFTNGNTNTRIQITAGGNVNIGGDYTQTSRKVMINSGGANAQLEVKGVEADIWMHSTGPGNTLWRIMGATGNSTHMFRVYDQTNTTNRLTITSTGNVNIGGDWTQTTYTMKVTGSFAATTKSFVIDHPTKENHSLRYACLEGPENSVYVRGKTSDSVIELPDYWKGLVHEDSITVNVTPIGNHKVWVEAINNNSVTIGSDGSEYFYTVFAERKDVDKLEVEVAK